MPKLPRATADETIRALERLGFERTRQCGRHVMPAHGQLAVGTLRSILRQAGVTPDEFMEQV